MANDRMGSSGAIGCPIDVRAVCRHTGTVLDLSAPVLQVAQGLLGAVVRFQTVAVRLTEVEAYAGTGDPAAHAVGGPRPSTKDLFGSPGTLYCYLSYGVHICGNIVCERAGGGSAVLLRAGEIVDGLNEARQRRPGVPDDRLARGPGCLGQAMGWTLASSGLMAGDGYTLLMPPTPPGRIHSGPRVGVSVGHQRPWRFWLDGEPSVSAYRRSPRAVSSDLTW